MIEKNVIFFPKFGEGRLLKKKSHLGKSQKLFWLFILVAILFVVGAFFNLNSMTITANYLLVPVLILYYRSKAGRWFLLMVIALLCFYVRDIFMLYGVGTSPWIVLSPFFLGLLIIYAFAITGFQRSKVHFVEWISLFIMYGFLGFLFYTISELVPQIMLSDLATTYIYLFLLILLLAITFTAYLLKSHYASLWLMLASASLCVSEISWFFKMYIISDVSVNIFFPLFHVIAYYALIEHALHRRRSVQLL